MCAELILYEVTVLKTHNTKRGIQKASDEKYYVYGNNAVAVKDLVEIHDRIPGIKKGLFVKITSQTNRLFLRYQYE